MSLRTIAYLAIFWILIVFSTSVAFCSTPQADYTYCKIHQISGSPDGSLTDYQVRFVIHRESGMDYGPNVYMNGKSKSWPNDFRLTDPSGNSYPYWIESYDQDTAVVWIKLDYIPSYPGTKDVNFYYGKPGDSGMSNGVATFLAFDDFDMDRRGTLWDEEYSMDGAWAWMPTHVIENGAYHLKTERPYDSAGYLQLKDALASPSVSVVTLEYNNLRGRSPPWVYISFDNGGAKNRYYTYTIGYWGGILGGFNPASPADTIRIEWTDGTTKNNVRIYRDDSLQSSGSANFSSSRTPSFGLRTASRETIDAYFTTFYAYKYTANPPSHGTWTDRQAPADKISSYVIAGLSETDVLLMAAIAVLLAVVVIMMAILSVLIFQSLKPR